MDYHQYTQHNIDKLASKLPVGAMVLISAAKHQKRNHDVYYPYRQSSHFYWLTAFEEPNAVFILIKTPSATTYLFHQGHRTSDVQWECPNLSHDDVKHTHALDNTLPIQTFEKWLSTKLKDITAVYTLKDEPYNALIKQHNPKLQTLELDELMRECRLVKSKIELALIRQACAITTQAHKRTIQATKTLPLRHEYQVAATFEYHCRMQSAHTLAYPTIAAGGNNSCILHYINNQQPLDSNECILMDAGCQWYNYAADITRTWPVSGQFTPEQKHIYQAVLSAQKVCIEALRPGVSMAAINLLAKQCLTESLRDIGIIKASLEQALEEQLYYPYFCHGIGHSLGLDVHDPQPKASDWILEEDMVITIEPGLYFPDHLDGGGPFKGIGIRIEDNIRITSDGYENLTQDLAKELDDIQQLVEGG